MKKFFFIAVTLSAFTLAGKAQLPDLAQRPGTVAGHYVSFSVDNLDNVYLLSATNQLKKINARLDSVSVFNDVKRLGEATLMDVSNPLKLLLYYKGFTTIAVLDGMLNLKTTIDLRRKNIFNVNAVCLSYDGKIWLYDEMEQTLKKLDDEGNVIFKTADFRQVFGKSLSPVKIFDQNRSLYLYDSLQGIYVFDYYGAYKSKIDITHWEQLRVDNNFIYGRRMNKLYRYNLVTSGYEEWPLPATLSGHRQLFLRNKTLYALHDEGLKVYR